MVKIHRLRKKYFSPVQGAQLVGALSQFAKAEGSIPSGHTQEPTHEGIKKCNNKSTFLSLFKINLKRRNFIKHGILIQAKFINKTGISWAIFCLKYPYLWLAYVFRF